MVCLRYGDDVTTDFLLTWQMGRAHVKSLSSSFDIDFIQGDIHGRPWKNSA